MEGGEKEEGEKKEEGGDEEGEKQKYNPDKKYFVLHTLSHHLSPSKHTPKQDIFGNSSAFFCCFTSQERIGSESNTGGEGEGVGGRTEGGEQEGEEGNEVFEVKRLSIPVD